MDLVRNPEKARSGLTWKRILAEEPFEGQHWEGAYGLPRGSVVGQDDVSSSGSSPSLSPWDDNLDDFDEPSSPWGTHSTPNSPFPSPPLGNVDLDVFTEEFSEQLVRYSHRDEIEALQSRQYWRHDWYGIVSIERPFNIGDPSTLSTLSFTPNSIYDYSINMIVVKDLAYHRATAENALVRKASHYKRELLCEYSTYGPQPKYIYEQHAVREILMGLQGRRNILFNWKADGANSMSFVVCDVS